MADQPKHAGRVDTLHAFRGMLELVIVRNDPTAVLALDMNAIVEAVSKAATPSVDEDWESRYLLGLWHFLRYLALPSGHDHADLHHGARLLEPIIRTRSDAVPVNLREYFAQYKLGRLGDQAFTLIETYQRTDDLNSLGQARTILRFIVSAAPENEPELGEYLSNLGIVQQWISTRTGQLTELHEAVEYGRRAIAASHDNHPNAGVYLSNLADTLHQRFVRAGQLVDLNEAIEAYRQALAVTPDGHLDRGGYLSSLGGMLNLRFERTGRIADLDEAVETSGQSVAATPDDHPNLGRHLSNLAATFHARFERTGQLDALDQAVAHGRRAIAATPDNHGELGGRLSNLSANLWARYKRLGPLPDLDEAIEIGRRAAVVTPSHHPDLGGILTNLTNVLLSKYERTDQLADLDEAIEIGRRAIDATPDKHPHLGMRMSNLGAPLYRKVERTGDIAALEEAIDITRRAVAHTTDASPDLGVLLSNLGSALQKSFERTGAIADLDEAVEVGRQAVAATPADHHTFGACLYNLGGTLRSKYERTGQLAVLDEAMEVGRRAVTATPDDHPNLGMRLSNLGNILQRRFEWTGQLTELHEAVEVGRRAVAATPRGDPELSLHLANLGSSLFQLFERTGQLDAIDEAIDATRRSLELTPDDHPELGIRLSNLGGTLRRRYERTSELDTLDEAIEAGRRAIAATPHDSPFLGGILSNVGFALKRRYERTSELDTLDEAIEIGRRAVAATPNDHPVLGGILSVLGSSLQSRYARTGQPEDLDEARRSFTIASSSESVPVDVRVQAAHDATDADLMAGDIDHALAMVEQAIKLLGLLAPRRLRRSDRQHRITRLTGLASTAATAALLAKQVDHAVEMLEQTRGLLIADSLDTRGDLSALHRHAPGLATEFIALREALDALDHTSSGPGPEGTAQLAYTQQARQREQLLNEWDRLLDSIRTIPELSSFLRASSIQQLRRAATSGPIVYIVVHALGSHAVLLTDKPDNPAQAIPLPGLTPDTALDHADQLRTAQRVTADAGKPTRDRLEAQSNILSTLVWLWDTVAGPVLDHLDLTAPPDEGQPWPRIYWCPVDIATFLPLHAAGHHPTTLRHDYGANGANSVMDRVVSSYVPTVRTLLHTLATTRPNTRPNRTLIISVPNAPDTPPLSGVVDEAAELQRVLPTATQLTNETATRDEVLNALPRHEIVHFACHGVADWADPTASRLILPDHHTHPLTVTDIAQLRLDHAELAYLSACSTTDTNPRHTDEATHLTAAFQLAGYRSVIGTLWPISDRAATTIATDVYKHLTRDGAITPQPEHAAEALHRATRNLRDAYPHKPTQWVAHIHAGH